MDAKPVKLAHLGGGTIVLWVVTTIAMCVAIWAAMLHAPEERVMGAVQKIFYFHLPSVFATYLAVGVLLWGSLAYLWTRKLHWDNLSRSANEVAVVLCAVVLITGSIWARPAWGAWWTWEARITTTLLLWLLLIACLMVRGYASTRELGARLASVVGIVAVLDIPIIHKAVVWWRGQHPVIFKEGEDAGLLPEMRTALLLCIVAFFLLLALLITLRYRQAALEDRASTIAERLSSH